VNHDHEYRATATIALPRSAGGKLINRGGKIRHSELHAAMDEKEIRRLIAQGWIVPIGLPPNLERGTTMPERVPLPAEVRYDDPEASGRGVVEKGVKGAVIPAGHPTVDEGRPTRGREDRKEMAREAERALAGERAEKNRDGRSIDTGPKVSVASPGIPRGKWDLEPTALDDLGIDQLNAIVRDRDDSAPTFAAGEEAEARAFLSQDFREGQPEREPPSASGDVSTEKRANVVRQGEV